MSPVKSGHAPKVDGGFCRGGDIVRAIAIGADRHQRPATLGARGQASRPAFLILDRCARRRSTRDRGSEFVSGAEAHQVGAQLGRVVEGCRAGAARGDQAGCGDRTEVDVEILGAQDQIA